MEQGKATENRNERLDKIASDLIGVDEDDLPPLEKDSDEEFLSIFDDADLPMAVPDDQMAHWTFVFFDADVLFRFCDVFTETCELLETTDSFQLHTGTVFCEPVRIYHLFKNDSTSPCDYSDFMRRHYETKGSLILIHPEPDALWVIKCQSREIAREKQVSKINKIVVARTCNDLFDAMSSTNMLSADKDIFKEFCHASKLCQSCIGHRPGRKRRSRPISLVEAHSSRSESLRQSEDYKQAYRFVESMQGALPPRDGEPSVSLPDRDSENFESEHSALIENLIEGSVTHVPRGILTGGSSETPTEAPRSRTDSSPSPFPTAESMFEHIQSNLVRDRDRDRAEGTPRHVGEVYRCEPGYEPGSPAMNYMNRLAEREREAHSRRRSSDRPRFATAVPLSEYRRMRRESRATEEREKKKRAAPTERELEEFIELRKAQQNHEKMAVDAEPEAVSAQDMTCKICMDNKIDTVLVPCGHACACSKCCVNIETKGTGAIRGEPLKCPMCRKSVIFAQPFHL